jgi:gas vesicle protein
VVVLPRKGEDGLDSYDQEYGNNGTCVWGFLAGLLVGGLAGAVAMLFLAPQSGKKTRAQIRLKGVELRDQTVKSVEGAVAQGRDKARQITHDVGEQTGDLRQGGQDMLDEQRGHLSKTLKDWGETVQA